MATWGFVLIGLRQSLCLNFFERVPVCRHWLFATVGHPQEFGFIAMIVAFSFVTDRVDVLAVSVETSIGMLCFQRVEDLPLSDHDIFQK